MPFGFRMTEPGHFFFEEPDCRLFCLHCSHGIKRRLGRNNRIHRLAGRLGAAFRRPPRPGLAGFERLAANHSRVCLSGYDVLESPGIMQILDVCRRRGLEVEIISPGLRLADAAFAERVAAYRPELLLTCLSRSPGSYEHMTGLPGVQELVDRALVNLKELEASFSVNFVATSVNCRELFEVARFLFDTIGLWHFSVLYFFPDRTHYILDARAPKRFASFETLNRQLDLVVGEYAGSEKRVCLWGLPPCKLDPGVLTSGLVSFSVPNNRDPRYRVFRHANCGFCRFADRCYFLSAYHPEARPAGSFDAGKVNRLHSSLVY